jgi:hypothetical protein
MKRRNNNAGFCQDSCLFFAMTTEAGKEESNDSRVLIAGDAATERANHV